MTAYNLALLLFLVWMPGGWFLAATKQVSGEVYAWVLIGLGIVAALLSQSTLAV